MFDSNPDRIRILKNQQGQVALFVALIFQVLFVFFAMVINVGLLVHHKINLQNAVDMAAYYGASKQAENLNAIGHMNYQVRQSWKLLAWRYRMIGSAGEFNYHPYKKTTSQLNESEAQEMVSTDENSPLNHFQEAPAFCITFIPFKPMPPGENTCKDIAGQSSINLFTTPRVFGFLDTSGTVGSAATALRNAAIERCKYFGSYNYLMLAKFVVAFNTDQRDRMLIINELSRTMSAHDDDFIDLDGDRVRIGIENTLKNNLTLPNKESFNSAGLKVYNSLGNPKCGVTTDKDRPVKWLSSIKIFPGFLYIDTECNNAGGRGGNTGGSIVSKGKELGKDEAMLPKERGGTPLLPGIEELKDYVSLREPLADTYNFSLGVEKNPWCMAYVGVSAETQPKVPFSPFGAVKLKARAFAKPFGGRIGPWYKDTWSRREMDFQISDGVKSVDALVPPRATDVSSLQNTMTDVANKKLRAANYSRYVGDPYGLKSAKMIGYYGRAIYELDPNWKSPSSRITDEYVPGELYEGDTAPNFADWDALPFKFGTETGDILAWSGANNRPSKMRLLEMSAVAPNAFDVAYYSIEPDFYHNYYLRMKKGFIGKVATGFAKNFRPDIGYHKGFKEGAINYDEYSVKDQVAEITTQDAETVMPIKEQLTFSVDKWQHVLTGWMGKSLSDYSLNPQTFGACAAEPEAGVPNPGHCVVGGTTGYSVKVISSDYLKSEELPLGGANTPKGKILNPPPDDF